jgi:Uma2 family endonuclease
MRAVERRTRESVRRAVREPGMAVRIAGRVEIPDYVRDHESFRRWARSSECPEHLRVAFYDGDLWVDPDKEQLYVHNQVKYIVGVALAPLVESRGIYITEGMLLSNVEAKFSTIPDGYFVSDDAFRQGRVRELPGKRGGFVELEGTPEMILEVVSDSSETKDLVDFPEKYWKAGVPEYWTIDVRTEDIVFHIWRRGPKGYVQARRLPGRWLKSEVFGRSFRLTQSQSARGRPTYTLEVK